MPTVNTITVTFGRKIAPKAYESMDASATLTLDFDEDEAAKSLPEEIQKGLEIVKIEVLKILNIAEKPRSTMAKQDTYNTKPDQVTSGETGPAIDKGPGELVKKKAPPKPKTTTSKPKADPAGDEKTYTQSDVMKSVTGAMEAMKKAGIANGAERVSAIRDAYLPDNKPPFSVTRIPATSRGDFIRDINDLKKVTK